MRPGEIVATRTPTAIGPVWHVGIISGPDRVIHNSKRIGRVVETDLPTFGQPVEVWGYPGRLPAHEVVRRARHWLGRPWRAGCNCEHLVCDAHGVPSWSPQMRSRVVTLGSVALLLGLRLGG